MKKNIVLKNAFWIIGCKIIQSLVSFIIGILSARYLGPSNYGIINYAASITSFVIPIMQLGFRSTLVQEIVEFPDKEGETLGTVILLNLISAFSCIIGVLTFVAIANYGETTTFIVCALYSINIVFQAVEMLQYWFQAKLISKYTSLVMLFAYVVVSFYKVYLLIAEKNIYWFAISQTIDYMLISISLMIIYKKIGEQKLSFSLSRGKEMISKSKYYIVSSLMVTIFAQTDKIMLKLMLGDEVTGFYSAAIACAGMTSFVFSAIIDSARPSIFESQKFNSKVYEENIVMLYSIIIYFSLIQCMVITIFSELIINVMYGADYSPAINILRLVIWYTTFSYLGPVRNIWILAEGKHKFLWIINMSGAIANIILNLLLIPIIGVMGAALASLITQIFTNFIIGFLIKPIRYNNYLMLKGCNPKPLIIYIKQTITKLRKRGDIDV